MSLDLNVISRQRKALMGAAIWMILLFHSWQDYNGVIFGKLFCSGDIGVELFAFLSGLGCYCSLLKNNLSDFFKKRAFRVFPSFLIASSAIAILRHIKYGLSYKQMISLISGLVVLRGDISLWFVTFIIICYLIAPILFRIKNRGIVAPYLTIVAITITTSLYFLLRGRIYGIELWLLRIPDFVLGFDCASLIMLKRDNDDHRATNLLICIIISLLILITTIQLEWIIIGWKFVLYFILCPFLIYCLAYIFDSFKTLSTVLQLFGSITLELYLGNCMSRHILGNISHNTFFSALFTIGTTFMFALILKQATTLLLNTLNKKIQ